MRLPVICFLVFFAFYAPHLEAQPGIISTVAGGGPFIFHEGDAHQVSLGEITSVALDGSGNVYAADISNRIVVRITPTGSLSIIFRLSSYSTAARIAVDNSGNIYVLESLFRISGPPPRITKIDGSTGQASTVLGGGLTGPSGLAVDANGNLYVSEADADRIQRIAPDGTATIIAGNGTCGSAGEGGPATQAQLCLPVGVALDQAGNVYIADDGTSRILRVTADGTITRIAGNGERGDTGDNGPALAAAIEPSGGIAVDAFGVIYFTQSNRIRQISPSGLISTLAGSTEPNYVDGSFNEARFRSPQSIAVAPPVVGAYVNVYIADTENWRIRLFSPRIGQMLRDFVSTVAGNGAFGVSGDGGPATSAALNRPYSVVVDPSGNLFYSDIDSHRVRKIDPNGIITTFAGAGRGFAGDGGPATQALLSSPADLALDSAGNLYIADSGNGRVRRVGTDGGIQTIAGGGPPTATGDGIPATSAYLRSPTGITLDNAGNIYVAEWSFPIRIRKITPDGIITTVQDSYSGTIRYSVHLATGTSGDLFVTHNYPGHIHSGAAYRITPDGSITNVIIGMEVPGGITLDGSGKVIVSESSDYLPFPESSDTGPRVLRVDTAPVTATNATVVAGSSSYGYSGDGAPAIAATLDTPQGLAVDSRGYVYIADSRNRRIRAVSPGTPPPCPVSLPKTSADVSGTAGTGGFNIATSGDCFWMATSNTDWIFVTKGSRTGPGAVFFSFGANPNYPNLQSTPRTGRISVAGQTFTITQAAAAASTGTLEPQLTAHLTPGFYIAEVTLANDGGAGFWGMEVLTSAGQTSGGFNLGGGLNYSTARPGFGAFLLPSAQTVTATATVPLAPQAHLTVQLLDSNRQVIVPAINGNSQFTEALQPGFYIVQITSDSDSPGPLNYSLALSSDSFSGGLDTGGYVGPGITGFGAFYLPVEQDVTIHTFGKNTYGTFGAGSLILTLRDANRNVIQQVGP